MQTQTKVNRMILPEVQGTKKTFNMNVLPEKLKPQIHSEQVDKNKQMLGRGRVGIKSKKPQPVVDITVWLSQYQNNK